MPAVKQQQGRRHGFAGLRCFDTLRNLFLYGGFQETEYAVQLLGILDAGVAAAEAGTRAEPLLEVRCCLCLASCRIALVHKCMCSRHACCMAAFVRA